MQQLEQRIVQLEARLLPATETAPTGIVRTGHWQDKANWPKIPKGISMKEVSALLGEPEKVNSGTALVFWYWGYPGGGNVRFGTETGLVEGWTEP